MSWGGDHTFAEKLYERHLPKGYAQVFQNTKTLFHEKTEFQDLIIFENPTFGRVMALDDIIQVTEGDEFVYHEMMVHVPILAHGAASRVLIIGGGDGGILREVLRHPGVEKATMVEIDRTVVDLCIKYMPKISDGAFDNPRGDLIITDGLKYVEETDERFDVIIVDSTDPIGPGESLFTQSFYANCKRCLNDGGVLVNQNGVPFFQPEEVVETHAKLAPLYKDASFYVAAVPTYVGGLMTLGWASDNAELRRQPQAIIAERFAAAGLTTRYYTPAVHVASFALPAFIGNLFEA